MENLFIQDKKIKGELDSLTDSYEEFLKILKNKISNDLLNKSITLRQLLGKAIRLVKDPNTLKEFEESLISDIKNKEFEYLSIQNIGNEIRYKVEKVPNILFDFDSL